MRRTVTMLCAAAMGVALVAPAAQAQSFTPSAVECQFPGAPNVDLICPGNELPAGEPSVAVDPRDPDHVVVSAMNEISCCSPFATTFDGGATWTAGHVSAPPPSPNPSLFHSNADSSLAFDAKAGTVVHLGISIFAGPKSEGDASIAAAVSRDGGITWGEPATVARGHGFGKHQIFMDKPWITADNNRSSPYYGRLYATWDKLTVPGANFAPQSEYGATMEAQSDDGGFTWSRPRVISGVNKRYCTFSGLGSRGNGRCDLGFFTTGVVNRRGVVTIAFLNPQNKRAWEPKDKLEDQYMVMRSTNGGRTWSNPRHVVNLETGLRDYPIVDHAETLTGYKLAVSGGGNIAIDRKSGRYYIVFSDNRAGRHDVRRPVTNTGVYAMRSNDGIHWHGPVSISKARRDQWMPFAAVDPTTHRLGVVFNDRSYRSAKVYNETLAVQRPNGKFRTRRVSTGSSHPTDGAYYLPPNGSPNGPGKPPCAGCSHWAGDYTALAYGSDGKARIAWSNMSEFLANPPLESGISGFELHPFFATR